MEKYVAKEKKTLTVRKHKKKVTLLQVEASNEPEPAEFKSLEKELASSVKDFFSLVFFT